MQENQSNVPKNNALEIPCAKGSTVMFYNVENLFDVKNDIGVNDEEFTPTGFKQWSSYNFDEKIKNIARVIRGVDRKFPILIGLAEVENEHVLQALANQEEIKEAQYKFVHENSKDERGADVALLYNPKFFHYLNHQTLSFYFTHTNGSIDYTRDILYVKGIIAADETLHIFVNHWPSRREGKKKSEFKRIKAAETLNIKVDEILLEDPKAKIIIMGDFNDEPYNRSIEQVLGAGNNLETNVLYNLHYKFYREKKGTIHYENQWMQFDQMLVSSSMIETDYGISIHKTSGRNFDEKWIMFRNKKGIYKPNKSYSGSKYHGGYSDHLPIYLTFEH